MAMFRLVVTFALLMLANTVRTAASRPKFSATGCGSSSALSITERELNTLGRQLWREDSGRVPSNRSGYVLDMQANAEYSGRDKAPRPLFKYVNPNVFNKHTVKTLMALFNNYEREIGRSEYVPYEERFENWDFINAVIRTRPMELVYQFLLRKKIVCSLYEFKRKLYYIWFDLYRRRNSRKRYNSGLDSSGFEHVFVGESDSSKVLGFHNWIKFYLEEKHRYVNYRGYLGLMKPSNLFTCKFSWHGKMKNIGGALVGVSPEFDFALYTLTFLSKVRNPVFQLGSDRVRVKCYGIAGGKIGTCYPILL